MAMLEPPEYMCAVSEAKHAEALGTVGPSTTSAMWRFEHGQARLLRSALQKLTHRASEPFFNAWCTGEEAASPIIHISLCCKVTLLRRGIFAGVVHACAGWRVTERQSAEISSKIPPEMSLYS